MALVVDTTKKYRNIPDGQNFTFSLSKPLNQLTAADLQSADFWVGFNCCSINQVYEGKGGEGIPENNPNYCNLWGTDPAWWYDQTNWASVHWSFPANQPNGIYMRNVYVNRELNPGDYTVANSTARIVLEISPDENTTMQKLCMIDNNNYLHAEYNTSSYDSQMSDYTYISPAVLLVINNCVYLVNQNIQRFFVPDNIGFFINSTTDQGYQSYFPSFENLSYHKLAMGWTMGYTSGSIEDNCVKTGTGSAPIYTYNDVDFNGHIGKLQLSGDGSNYHIRIRSTMSINADDSDFSLIHRAYSGVRFRVSGTWYKPIIQGGIVTGYTDDMLIPSEWDNWTKATGHNVPSGGGGGGGTDEDNDDPISTAGTPFGTGLAHYYVTTVDSTILSQISEAMSSWDIDATKKDLYRNLISCKLMKPPAGIPATASVFEIYGVKPQYQGADITINAVDGNPDIAFDAIDIPRKFNDFRDYAPYSKAEIFIPYCGWTALPSHVIGRSVSVSYFTDVIAGTVKAVVFCRNNVVAEAAGVMAVDIPFASQNVGAKVQAATTGLLSYGQGAFQAAVGIGQMVATKGQSGVKNLASGLAGVIGGTAQMAMTANENWTEINGKSGDGTCLAGVDTIIVKITRPKYGDYEAPYYVPAEFPHTVGFISMKKALVSSCTGLIICDNVDTSGIAGATDRERQLIKNYLENGIIVEHPETP